MSKCPKCGGKVRQQVNVFVDAPGDCRDLSKHGMRPKEVRILGVDWPRASYYCANGCGYYLRLDGAKK